MKIGSVLYFTFLIIVSITYAIPIQQEFIHITYPALKQTSTNDHLYLRLDQLEKYYSHIVNKAFDSNVDELLESMPETFLTIHELQLLGKGNNLKFTLSLYNNPFFHIEYCQTSLFNFLQILEVELKNSKNNALVSIRPMLETNLRSGVDSLQLNLLFDPNHLAASIIHKLYASDMTAVDKIIQSLKSSSFRLRSHHEKNEAMALKAWLQSWLMDIEFALNEEFTTP